MRARRLVTADVTLALVGRMVAVERSESAVRQIELTRHGRRDDVVDDAADAVGKLSGAHVGESAVDHVVLVVEVVVIVHVGRLTVVRVEGVLIVLMITVVIVIVIIIQLLRMRLRMNNF